jgi:hypothetical protein
MPAKKVKTEKGKYYFYPTLLIEVGKVFEGFTALAKLFRMKK